MRNISKIRLFQLLTVIVLFLPIIGFWNCAPTTNYYTGRTLEKGKMMYSFGMDNILIQNPGDGFSFNKNIVTPSLGFARGFPYRFEAGLRWYFQKTFEGSLRWQINPRDFPYFDISTNFHYGSYYLAAEYFKYGLTFSKQFYRFEPFVSHYWYANGEMNPDPGVSDIWKNNRVMSTGIAIKIKEGYIVPEINYQFTSNSFNYAYIFYSLGIRHNFKFKH